MKRLSLIGMAGIGKSYWAKKLEAEGFRRFCCDDLIAGKLGPQLIRSDGATMTMGEWMGFPFHEQYEGCEHKYLSYEIEVLNEVLAYLGDSESLPEENIVVDTTGSVAYTGQEHLEALRRLTTVVYLITPPEVRRQLLEAYVARPHPMIWKGMFDKKPEETNEQALERCYPRLLAARQRTYELFADVTIDYYRCRQKDFGVREMLEAVEKKEGTQR